MTQAPITRLLSQEEISAISNLVASWKQDGTNFIGSVAVERLLADREELVRQRDAMRNGLVALQKKFLRVFGKESIEIDEILSSLTLP